MWSKKIHVKSSMPKKEGQFHLLVGRWQPLHAGHKQMFQQILDRGDNICIAIREGKIDEKNPFSSQQVYRMLIKEYITQIADGRVKIIHIPDICSIDFGRGVGYDIVEHIPPPEIGQISATKIREQMKLNNNEKDSQDTV